MPAGRQYAIGPPALFDGSVDTSYLERFARPPFELGVLEHSGVQCRPGVFGSPSLSHEMSLAQCQDDGRSMTLTYAHEQGDIEVDVSIVRSATAAVFTQTTTVRNVGYRTKTLSHVSSGFWQGVGVGGSRPWFDSGKLVFWYARQVPQGEGQWRAESLDELGLLSTHVHPTGGAIVISSTGSRSTGRYQPLVMVENTETNVIWYLQIDTSGHWLLELGSSGSGTDPRGSLYLDASAADEKSTAWAHRLHPGEQYVSFPAVIGSCCGGFEEAVCELTRYRREARTTSVPGFDATPVVFNDYMNCLWADPTPEALDALLGSASRSGAEVFCVDAGWFTPFGGALNETIGDWEPQDERFGPGGFDGFIRRVREAGMVPGCWLELEVCGTGSRLAARPDTWFLTRHGIRVSDGVRYFLNLTNPEVRVFLLSTVSSLADRGIGYIKNDYNGCLGIGADGAEISFAEGLNIQVRALYALLNEIRVRHPGLILETCSSGAMRADGGVVACGHVQSVSDQEIYWKFPSIISGSMALLLPEQAGVWAYPYPLLFEQRASAEALAREKAGDGAGDHEQTIFNMVNGLCGALCLSGRIDWADQGGLAAVSEAVELYKRVRHKTSSFFPAWPTGMLSINHRDRWASFALRAPDRSEAFLAVWRLFAGEDHFRVPLRNLVPGATAVRRLFPLFDSTGEFRHDLYDQYLEVMLSRQCAARFFHVTTGRTASDGVSAAG